MFQVVDNLRSIEFGNPGESRARLIDFIVNGNKRATAGLLDDYAKESEPVESVGECLAMLNNDNQHVATLRVTRVEVSRFIDVPDEFALAEAEGDLNAADFRASHNDFWSRIGETVTDETQIVQVYFELLTHRLRPLQSSDAEWIYHACQDTEVQRWTQIPRPYTREHAKSFVIDQNGELLANAIIDSRTGEPAGVAGIHHIKDGVATVGYWIAPQARRAGAASTALKILPTIARRLGDAQTVRAIIAETNVASRATAERAGFKIARKSAEQCPDGANQTTALDYELTFEMFN
ncbi:MAG: GNAT family N-acetyltransferase [Actinomycetota bacterium]|nr:GNAT family N-acetyltransferase [Actinomycetota bacterium]